MLAKSNPDGRGGGMDQTGHPVIRTLYDHLEEVTTLEFHPKEPILASGSNDFTIKLFDYSKASAKKAFKTITDAAPITCMSFHPTGDYLISGTTTPVIRLYDVNTTQVTTMRMYPGTLRIRKLWNFEFMLWTYFFQCFVSSVAHHQHTAEVTTLKWSGDGKQFCSGSLDGSIKVGRDSRQCSSSFIVYRRCGTG